jgi:integral membrane protein
MHISPAKLFGGFAVAEAITWALLITALIVRAVVGVPPEVFFVVGALHGFTFLGYAVVAGLVGVNQRWSFPKIALGVALAIVPFATVPFEKSLRTKNLLLGDWRTAASDDLRDRSVLDRLFRYFIRRPVLLILVLVMAVTAVFLFLLWLGPPGSWFA